MKAETTNAFSNTTFSLAGGAVLGGAIGGAKPKTMDEWPDEIDG